MAEELRGTQYHDGSAAATVAAALLENTADKDMHIRFVGGTGYVETADANVKFCLIQIGKNNAISTTDNESGMKIQKSVGTKSSTTGGTLLMPYEFGRYFAKGQFILEPGETLYYHKSVSTNNPDGFNASLDVYYHY